MKLVTYSNDYNGLLESYFNHPNTPNNNNSHKNIKSHLYDGDNGILFFIEDNNVIVATFGAVVVKLQENVECVKLPHRLHVRKDYSKYHHSFVDKFFEPALYQWLDKKQIYNIMQTVNEGNERAGFVSWLRHKRRRLYSKKYVNEIGKNFIDGDWCIQPFLINEMHTWQYCAWVSINQTMWNKKWRDTKDISPQVIDKLNSSFTFSDHGWKL